MPANSTDLDAGEATKGGPAPDRTATMKGVKPNEFWWPQMLNLQPLRDHAPHSSPIADLDYAAAFATLDLAMRVRVFTGSVFTVFT